MRPAAPLLLLLSACIGGGPCSTSSPLPAADDCDHAVTPVGPLAIEVGGDVDPFTPWADDAVTRLVIGGQGTPMIALRTRLTAATIPGCVLQSVRVVRLEDGGVAGTRVEPVKTYAAGGGAATTKALYVPLSSIGTGDALTVEVTVGTTVLSRRVHANARDGTCDELRARWLELVGNVGTSCSGASSCHQAGIDGFGCEQTSAGLDGCGRAVDYPAFVDSELPFVESLYHRCGLAGQRCPQNVQCIDNRCTLVDRTCP